MALSTLDKNKLKQRVAALSIASNTLLVIIKVAAGLTMGSISVISEAIHSGIDLIASFIAFFAVRIASRPADDDHQYGHGKFENISGTVEALLIFIAAWLIISEAIGKIKHPHEVGSVTFGLVIMAISAIVNAIVSRILFKTAKLTDSVALEADALHLSTDVWTSVGIFVGLAALKITGINIIDPMAAIIVGIFIIKEAFGLTMRAAGSLVDKSLTAEENDIIENIIEQHKQDIYGYHALRTRKSGAERHIDLHLVLDGNAAVAHAHGLCDKIEEKLATILDNMHVLIHVEPCPQNCNKCAEYCFKRGEFNS